MERVEELDFARVLSMLAVMMIHVSAGSIYLPSRYVFLGMNPAFWLNQLSRFAVPLFILLSGLSLGLAHRRGRGVLTFYGQRLGRLLPPYLIWTLIYWLHGAAAGAPHAPGRLLRTVLLGQAAPHLYFVIILLQCCALFPAVMRLLSCAPVPTLALSAALTYLVQSLYLFRRLGLDLIPAWIRPYLWMSVPAWALFFVAGCALSSADLAAISAFSGRHAAALLLCSVFYGAILTVEAHLSGYTDSVRATLNLYVFLVLLSCFALWRRLGARPLVRRWVQLLSRHSMTVYFSHVLILDQLRRCAFFSRGTLGMMCLYCAVAVLSILLSVCIDSGAHLLLMRLCPRRSLEQAPSHPPPGASKK